MFSKTRSFVRTHPWGSINNKCFGCPPFRPVSTYWPRVFWDSLTRKSPSLISKDSEKIRVILPWNHFSDKSFASVDWVMGSERKSINNFNNKYNKKTSYSYQLLVHLRKTCQTLHSSFSRWHIHAQLVSRDQSSCWKVSRGGVQLLVILLQLWRLKARAATFRANRCSIPGRT